MSDEFSDPFELVVPPLDHGQCVWCGGEYQEGHRCEGVYWVSQERARCRAIVFRLFGADYTGNEALAEIDHG